MDTTSYNEQLRNHLRKLLNRTIGLQLAAGLVDFVAVGSWVFLAVILWTAASSQPELWKAVVVSRGAIAVGIALFGWLVVLPLVKLPRLDTLAAEVEKRKDLRELLRAGFEFSQDETVSRRYSPDLVKEVIRQAARSIEGLQVRFLFLNRKDIALMPLAYGGLGVMLVLSLARPSLLVDAGRRVTSPSRVSAAEHRANLQVAPGDVTVLAGSNVTVTGLDFGRTPHTVSVSFNLSEDFWKTEPTTREETTPPGAEPLTDPIDRYSYTFADLRHTVSYYFESGDFKSPTYTITVVHEPILNDLDVTLTPPSYTGEPPVTHEDNGGNVQALEGTQVVIRGQANNPLSGAWVKFGNSKEKPIDHEDRTVTFGFRALKDDHYSVILEDTLGHKTGDPLVYTVEVFKDHAPSLDVLEPGGDAMLPRNRELPVGFVASDDYGVRDAAIFYRKSGEEEFKKIDIPLDKQRGKKEIAAAYLWSLADVTLFPGNYIEYFVQVRDNNVVTGPGVARSRMFQINVPTMAELYDKIQDEDTRRGDMFEEALKESAEFRERLEKITREFIKTEKMEWTQKKEVDKALETQKAVEDKLQDIKQSLDETLAELSDNEMTSQEIGQKLEEIRELMEEINSEELQKYMEQLKESIENLNPEEIKEALENLEVNAQDMLEKLDRTANLLREIAKEQKMEELVRQSENLMQEQKELYDETTDTKASDENKMGELSERQSDLAEKAKALEQSMKEFAEEMSENDQQVAQQMQEASSQLDQKEGAQKNMKNAAQSLQQMQKQSAQQQQQQAMDQLISLFKRQSQIQQQMQMNMGMKMAANLQKFAKQMLDLSFRQEQLTRRLREMREQPGDAQALAQDQNSYLKATEKVADEIVKMSGQSLSISPQLMKALGSALERMQSSVLFLEQNKPFMSTAHATNAVESLNQATIEMLRSAESCSKGGGSSQSMAQQMLQQLIPQQQNVIQQTRQMMEMQALAEQMHQERMDQMGRVAAQQRSLKELAQQIQESLRENKDVLGRLDKTVDDMEDVTRSLERGNVDEDLVNKEYRILSRLLDAQRSINTKDYEKKRESVTADEIFSRSLGPDNHQPESQSLREEIRRAMQLKAPGEFEDLIKLYFRALAEESSAGSN